MNGDRHSRPAGGGVPPRWLRCPRKSEGFIGEKFIVFKTPLSSNYDGNVAPQWRFHPKMILDYMKMQKLNLGLWIDLTNTDRFYPSEAIEKSGTKYAKINCRGHGEAPSNDQTKIFVRLCQQYINKNPLDIIGVHCTHGFNRTGYLVCAFLVEMWDWSIHAALSHFAKLRPPGIYKQDYIDQLYRIYGSQDEPILSAPVKPDWCFEDEDVEDDDGYAGHQSNGPSSSRLMKRGYDDESPAYNGGGGRPHKQRRAEFVKLNPTFMEGVPGVLPVTDKNELSSLQRKVQEMCGWRGTGFPGLQPVSMDMNNILLLEQKPYMVSWKADGTRYLMLIDGQDRVYFVDRDNCVFKVDGISFLYRKNLYEHLAETLCDGEMVLDKVNDAMVPRYLIYDIIKFRGEDVGKTDFRIRLNCIRDELITPRHHAIERGIIDRNLEPFGVRHKEFWFLDNTEKVLDGLAKELVHEPDGLIFQPTKEAYVCGRYDEVLKWKPPSLNTIDFRLKIVTHTGEGLLPTRVGELYVGGLNTAFTQMKVTKAIAALDGKIVECKLENHGWVFLRERTDKSFPNGLNTAKGVLQSIQRPVTKDFLLDFIQRRRFRKFCT